MKKHKDCSCTACIAACKSHPGSIMPGNLKRLASFLGISEQELFDKHIAVLDLGWVRVPFPAGTHFPPGRVTINTEKQYHLRVRCHWLDNDGLCMVHEAKPTECAETMPCKKSYYGVSQRRKTTCHTWARAENKLRLARLLGEVD